MSTSDAQWQHATGRIAGFEFSNVLGVKTAVRIGLCCYLIRASESVEVIYIE